MAAATIVSILTDGADLAGIGAAMPIGRATAGVVRTVGTVLGAAAVVASEVVVAAAVAVTAAAMAVAAVAIITTKGALVLINDMSSSVAALGGRCLMSNEGEFPSLQSFCARSDDFGQPLS
jgi:hypothetical protein